jgi:hypothetical protein
MNTQKSAVALRLIIVAAITGVDGDSLDQLNSFELPDGMLVSVISQGALYRFELSSTATPSSTVGNVVAPAAGPGRFVLIPGGGGASAILSEQISGTALLAAAAAFAVVQNTWIAIPGGTGFYTAPTGGVFTPNSSTGTLTYAGPDASYRISATATIESGTAADEVDLAIDTLGTLAATTTFVPSAGVTNALATAPGASVSTSVIRTLHDGNVIQALVRNVTGAHNLTVPHLNLIASPL